MTTKFTEIIPKPKDKNYRHIYGPQDFQVGDRIRIYLAYWTQDVTIREGIVIDSNHTKDIYPSPSPSLEILVDKKGRLDRDLPKNTGAANYCGNIVWGHPVMEKVEKPYRRSYIYSCITRAEKLK